MRAAHATLPAHHAGGLRRAGEHRAGGSRAGYWLHRGLAASSRFLTHSTLTTSYSTEVSDSTVFGLHFPYKFENIPVAKSS